MADWKTYKLTIPGTDLFKKVRDALEVLVALLDFLKALLNTVKVFLVDFGNPLIALIQALILLLEAFINSLRATGLFGLYHVPPVTWDDFLDFFNGTAPFTEVFKASLFDGKDYNRPQPITGATKSGFILLVVDASDVATLVRRIQQLLALFGKEFAAPRLRAPQNVKVFPLDGGKDPLLSLPAVFGSPTKALAVEWSNPTQILPPDPGFEGQLTSLRDEFTAPGYLIERTEEPTGKTVTHGVEQTDLRGRVSTAQFVVREDSGRLFREYSAYFGVAPGDFTATFLLGSLGTFRFIDDTVEKGKRYTYRVRPFLGELGLDPVFHEMPFPPLREKRFGLRQFVQDYPGKNLILGDPSPEASGVVADLPLDFDVLNSLRTLFKTAFSLNFHLPLPVGATFDNKGFPTGVTSPSSVGKGSLLPLASSLSQLVGEPVAQEIPLTIDKTPPGAVQSYEEIGNLPPSRVPKFPWQTFTVRRRANQLAIQIAGAMLDNQGTASRYKALMTGGLPFGQVQFGILTSAINIEGLTTGLVRDPGPGLPVETLNGAYNLYFMDPVYRLNVLAAVKFALTLASVGTPPNWVSISVFRDIVPWLGEIFNDILAKIQALVDAYNGAIKEIKAYIDLIQRKIDALENFLKFLISILDQIEALELTVSVLNSGTVNVDASGWADIVDSASTQPAAPSRDPNGYSAGVALAYVGSDVKAFETALEALFGK